MHSVARAVAGPAKWVVTIFLLAIGAGCDVWAPPAPTPAEYDRGLVVMYPGSTNTRSEMTGFHTGLRDAGIDQAIEVVPWALPFVRYVLPGTFLTDQRPWARAEAMRISAYRGTHPGVAVTLLGFSGGAMMAIMVAEELPEGIGVDSVILLSAGVSSGYDLTAMLEKSTGGAFVYFSPREEFALWLAQTFGTVDGDFQRPAAVFGFDMTHPGLTQLSWDAAMQAEFGNNGDHFDYFLNPAWIARHVAPWVAPAPPGQTSN
ncbi:MAG: hypothetical protein DCC65_12895 [Planctomycetota bacterium]|nr:MAG: hypothetical protein DCC65_12895 [Planctomycetota bacterium]